MTLAEKLLSLRTQRGLSQEDLAERMEVSRQSVSKWETGQGGPDLDKIIKLADLFGVSVDELVREGERPQPPEPPQPQVVYVEREKHGLTAAQKTGIVFVAMGAILCMMGFLGVGVLILIGPALIILALPLLLAKKHPWLIDGWLIVAMSLLILNPNTSVSPWGLIGGLRYVRLLIENPAMRYRTYYFAAAVGIIRGVLFLALALRTEWLCGRAWKEAWKKWRKDG